MLGGGTVTLNVTRSRRSADSGQRRYPVVAPVGTGTAMLVALHAVGVPAGPLNVTVFVPWLAQSSFPSDRYGSANDARSRIQIRNGGAG